MKTWLIRSSLLLTLASATVMAQVNPDDVAIEAIQLDDNVYMLTGAGGNIGVQVDPQGVIMIDAQYAPLRDKIVAAIAELTSASVTTLVNTHFHGDHTDGNAAFAEYGVTIIAHENVYERLQANDDFKRQGLPRVTFADQLGLRTQAGELKLQYYPDGHTDGDIVVWFADSNVIHAGDLFFHNRFPFIDLEAGGTVQGYIDNVSAVISKLDEETQVIPGHGPLSNKTEWQALVDMIEATRRDVDAMRADGLSEDEAVKRGLNETWRDWSWSFITEERWIRTLYQDREQHPAA